MTLLMPPFWAQGGFRAITDHGVAIVVLEPTIEPLSMDEVKRFARIDGDDQNGLLDLFLRSARCQVEQETGLALLTQTRDVYFDALPLGRTPVALPAQSRPLQSVTSIKSTDTAGVVNTLDIANYDVDLASGRIGLSLAGLWPTDLRPFQPLVIRVVAGWTSPELIPAPLVHAVGLLAGHFANEGRDRFTAADLYDEYEERIAPYRLISVA